jgi:hypothetical protein
MMNWFRFIASAILAGLSLGSAAASDPTTASPAASTAAVTLPPVLRPLEPAESMHLTLPGPTPPATPPKVVHKFNIVPPVAKMAKLPTKLVEDPLLRQPLPRFAVSVPTVAAQPPLPTELAREVAVYCQKQIGHWTESDAHAMLGRPKRQRPAYDEKKAVNGTIYAYADPTGRYKEMELDFDRESGHLRTVFVYPPKLTWQECRRLWAGEFTSADARQGRMFYSYTNRRLDVLVDAAGKVVSLGWY